MAPESWLKVGLPAYPVAFTVFGIWLYWRENPLPALAPAVAFWGVVILFYLFSHCELQNKSYPIFLVIGETVLWLVSSITSHNLGKFLLSKQYTGLVDVLSNTYFWFAYGCCIVSAIVGLLHFFRLEPLIAAQVRA